MRSPESIKPANSGEKVSATPAADRQTGTSWRVPGALLLLSAVPVAAGVARLLQLGGGIPHQPEDARFFASPGPVVLHVVGATLFGVLGAFQFSQALRLHKPQWHRCLGRLTAFGGALAALSGLWMTVMYPIPTALQGELLYVTRLVVGLLMTLALGVAVREILNRRVGQHKAWMLRAYALGQGAGTQVLIMLPVTLLWEAPTFFARDALMVSAWVINAALAEWLIRRKKTIP